jgi:hypothetical protein
MYGLIRKAEDAGAIERWKENNNNNKFLEPTASEFVLRMAHV